MKNLLFLIVALLVTGCTQTNTSYVRTTQTPTPTETQSVQQTEQVNLVIDQEFTTDLFDTGLSPSTISIPTGGTVGITITNKQIRQQQISISGTTIKTRMLRQNDTETIIFTTNQLGQFSLQDRFGTEIGVIIAE